MKEDGEWVGWFDAWGDEGHHRTGSEGGCR